LSEARGPGRGLNPLAAVMKRVAAGDHEAFADLYDVTASRSFGIALRMLRNQALAEEVVQDVMIELWQTARRYDETRSSVDTWAVTIAHRRAVDRVRHERSSKERERIDAVRSRSIDFDQTAESVVRHHDINQVRGCLRTLTDLQRQAVVLAYYEGYTYPEVAEVLDVHLPAVKARIRDGLRRLRNCLRPLEIV
jgi:RNA polymerase sigma-70 factor (ECF subfamily)